MYQVGYLPIDVSFDLRLHREIKVAPPEDITYPAEIQLASADNQEVVVVVCSDAEFDAALKEHGYISSTRAG